MYAALRPIPFTLLLTLSLATTTSAYAADEKERIQRLTQQLVALRGSVNDLADQLDLNHEAHKQTIRSLMTQKSQVESSLRQERLSLEKLQVSLEEQKTEIATLSAGSEDIEAVVVDTAAKLRDYVSQGLPFKAQERTAAVDELVQRLQADLVPPARAANELWALIEDEIRLTSENGLYRQTLRVGDEDILADVAKVGMMLLYFKLDDERYGVMRESGEGWRATVVDGDPAKRQIAQLFDAFRKQIRTGQFTLPNAL